MVGWPSPNTSQLPQKKQASANLRKAGAWGAPGKQSWEITWAERVSMYIYIYRYYIYILYIYIYIHISFPNIKSYKFPKHKTHHQKTKQTKTINKKQWKVDFSPWFISMDSWKRIFQTRTCVARRIARRTRRKCTHGATTGSFLGFVALGRPKKHGDSTSSIYVDRV